MSRPVFTKSFWLDAAERLIKTEAQTIAATFTVDAITKGVSFEQGATVVIAAGIFSICTSIVSTGVGEPGTASLLNPAPPDTLDEPPVG